MLALVGVELAAGASCDTRENCVAPETPLELEASDIHVAVENSTANVPRDTRQSPSRTIAIGVSQALDYHQAAEIGFEYRFTRFRPLPLRPIVGFSANQHGSYWGFAGLRLEWRPLQRLTIAPSFSIVLYEKGDGRNLGGPLEFRSGLDLGLRVGANQELGLSFYHLSNGRLYSFNPGTESLVLTWSR